MPKPKWNLNTVYISERLQESLRPVSRCALTTEVAPMGYGKTTAVNWYLEERARLEPVKMIRVSVYSDNLAILWKSVQDAFAREGFGFMRDCDCPEDAASGGLLADDLCHELAGETPCYIFIDDFHLLTDRRAASFLCMLTNRLPANVHLIVASRDRFLPVAETLRLGAKVYQIGTNQLRLNHMELAVYAHRCGTYLTDAQVESLLYSSEGWFSAVYLNLRTLSERGVLPDRNSDIYTTFTAAMIDPLPEQQRAFLVVMGLADEFTAEMAQFITGDPDAERMLSVLTAQNAFVKRLPDGVTYRFHHMMKECAERSFMALFAQHRLAEVNILALGKPMTDMIENQVYLAQGAYAKVIGRSDGLLAACEGLHYALVALHVRIQTAAAYKMLGKHDEARELLARAISDAEADDFVMPFAENFRYLRPLLSERPHSDFTARISEFAYSNDWQYYVGDWAMVFTKSYVVYMPEDYDGLVLAAEPQPDNYRDTAKRMQLDSISPEGLITELDTLDPYACLYFSVCC